MKHLHNIQSPRESGLAFQNVTLRQSNARGQLLWQLRAKAATYLDQRQVVQVQEMAGELFQNGKPAFTITADQAQVEQKGHRVILKGKITATDITNQTVFRGQEVEWRPQAHWLEVRKDLSVYHPQLQIWAKTLRASNRTHQVEVWGNVTAQTQQPQLRLKTEHLIWYYKQQELKSDRPLAVQHQEQAIQATARQGYINQPHARVQLTGAVQMQNLQQQFQLKTQQLIWSIPQQQIEAMGQVSYTQKKPQFQLRGSRAIGKMQAQTIQMNGDVVTEIFP